jgi:peptidoglycan hydrolase CwlO-like protein
LTTLNTRIKLTLYDLTFFQSRRRAMNKWISISIIVVLVVALVASLFLYFQGTSNLKTAEDEIVNLEGNVSDLEGDITTLEIDLETAESDISTLEGEISVLESDIAGNELEISSLQSNLAEVELAISTLESDLATKEAEISTLETDLATADTEVSRLEGELATAQGDITGLEGELATAQAEVESRVQALTQTQEEKAALESQISDWESAYESINNEIFQKLGHGDYASIYLTPNDQIVGNIAISITGGLSQDWDEHWRDVLRLYDWVVNNIAYNFDTPLPILPVSPTGNLDWIEEYWQMPSETVELGTGDCEDMAVLLQSLILGYENEQYSTWGIGLQSDNGGHLAVALPVDDGNLVILDPAGQFYTNGIGFIDTTKSITQAINEWLQYWSYDMPNVYIDFVFSSNFSEYFNSTNEFIAWATS